MRHTLSSLRSHLVAHGFQLISINIVGWIAQGNQRVFRCCELSSRILPRIHLHQWTTRQSARIDRYQSENIAAHIIGCIHNLFGHLRQCSAALSRGQFTSASTQSLLSLLSHLSDRTDDMLCQLDAGDHHHR